MINDSNNLEQEQLFGQSQVHDYFKDITFSQIATFFMFGVVLSLASDIRDNSSLFMPARFFIAGLAVLSIFLPSKWGLPLFFMIALLGPDRLQSSSEKMEYGELTSASFWRLWIGPLRPSMVIFLFIFIHTIKVGFYNLKLKCVRWISIWCLTIPLLTSFLYGGFFTPYRSIELIADIRVPIILITSIVLFYSFLLKYPSMLSVMLALFIGCLLGRHFLDFFYWIIGFGSVLSGFYRVSVDATKPSVIFLLLFGSYLFFAKKKFLLGFLIALISLILVVVYSGRILWLCTVLGIVFFMFIIGFKKGAFLLPFVLIVFILVFNIVLSFRSENIRALEVRASTFSGGGSGNYLQQLDPLRYGEMINSFNTNLKRMAFLWGSGYGSYYTDDLIKFPRDLVSAFEDYSAVSGQFFNCHDYFLHVFFKHGFIGLVIITFTWLRPIPQAYSVYKKMHNGLFKGGVACLIAFLPLSMIQFYWSGKGLFLSAFLIAFLLATTNFFKSYNDI